MLVRSLASNSRKRLPHDVFDTFAANAGLVYDVTDTADCWTPNGSTHSCVFAIFKRRIIIITITIIITIIIININILLLLEKQDEKNKVRSRCI